MSVPPDSILSRLKEFEALKEVPDEQLAWLIEKSEYRVFQDGEFLFKPDDPLDNTHFMLKGAVKVYRNQTNQQMVLGVWEGGTVTGYLPFSRGKIATGFGLALEETEVVSFPKKIEKELIVQCYELTQALVQVMTSRVRDFTAVQKQNEKMMALGKLSAGLTHELNNPAAAIVRGSAELIKHLQLQPETFKHVIAIRMTDEQVDTVNGILFAKLRQERPQLSLLDRTEREDDMAYWLEDHHIEEAAMIAENLVEFGFSEEDMEEIARHVPDKDLKAVLRWIDNNLTTEKMVADIQEASERISKLIGSVKSYTHMDRAPEKHPADIHAGIRNTLTMLNHKIKKNNIRLLEDFDDKLPLLPMFVSEINQVWTNVIDNALDALEGRPDAVLTIKTELDGRFAKVVVHDNGPGIPADIISRIWEPFFTTKEMGKGTGLGLELVHKIVAQHQGEVSVKSVPGSTSFIFCFPIEETSFNSK